MLVWFPDARRALVVLASAPRVGRPLDADVPGNWLVSHIHLEPGGFDGEVYPYELVVEPRGVHGAARPA